VTLKSTIILNTILKRGVDYRDMKAANALYRAMQLPPESRGEIIEPIIRFFLGRR
jgi:hypothetical protein